MFYLYLQYQGYLQQVYKISMEPQFDNNTQVAAIDYDEGQLIALIIRSFKGRTQEEVKQASELILRSLSAPGMIHRLVKLLNSPVEQEPNLKKAVALVIKKYSFQCASLPGDKSQLIESIYTLIMTSEIELAAKDVLGTALQNLLNADKQGQYKEIILSNILSLLNSLQAAAKLQGCLIGLQAYFNTLKEIEDELDFLENILQILALNGMNIYRQVNAMAFQTWLTCDQSILLKISKMFSFLQSVFERIFEDAEEVPEYITSIRQNPILIQLLQSYLLLFHNNHSIISKVYNPINEIKRVLMNIVVTLYKLSTCPQGIFRLIFITFLSESHRIVDDFEVQSILVLCIDLLDDHLQRKLYEELFGEKKLDIIFSLLLYSVTNLEEFQLIEQNPEKFVELAEDYTQASMRSDYLKIKAGVMLQVFIQKVDEALRNVVEILIMICAEVLQPDNRASVPQIGQTFGQFMFYKLSDELKLQTSCMVLANLSRFINRRYDLLKLVNSFLSSHFTDIMKVKSHLPVLRIIRLISYYPSAIYFVYIESNFTLGKVFIIEGIKSLERIIKTNRYPELLGLLASIITRLMGVIKISDPVMQIIVLNQHQTMLKRHPLLYRQCRQKIKEQFFLNKDINQHAALICFNLIGGLLEKEKDENNKNEVINVFYDIVDFLMMTENKEAFLKYEEKLIEIVDLIITLRSFTSPEIEKFVERTMRYLSRYEKGSGVFKMYNNYICKMQGAVFKLQEYFKAFWEEVKSRVSLFFETEESLEPISYYCLLMSQIIGSHTQLNLTANDFDEILTLAGRVPNEFKQYPLIVFLSYSYEMPYQAVSYLRQKDVYGGFLEQVTKVQFDGQLPKKIIILAFIRLIEIEEHLTTFKVIMEYCVRYLKLQYQKSKRSLSKIPTYEIRPRRFGQQRLVDNQEIQEEENDNEMINIFVKFKHPYRNLSEYDNFKVILSHRHGMLRELSPELIEDIKMILETQWVDNSTRRIVKVAK